MLPSVKVSCVLPAGPVITALKFCTLSLCKNGAGEPPRYHEMVGTGLPVELQVMLTESPSCTVTVSFRFMVVGTPAAKHFSFIGLDTQFLCSVANAVSLVRYTGNGVCKEVSTCNKMRNFSTLLIL